MVDKVTGSDDLKKSQKETINALADLADAKAEAFGDKIKFDLLESGTTGNEKIPIEAVLMVGSETHAYSSDKQGSIVKTTTDAIKKFIAGGSDNIVDGLGKLVGGLITTFLGEAEGNTGTKNEYYVIREGASLVRLDFKGWYMAVQVTGFTDKFEKVTAFVMVKSAVDMAKVKLNTFLYFYRDQLGKPGDLSADAIEKEINEAKKLLQEFRTT